MGRKVLESWWRSLSVSGLSISRGFAAVRKGLGWKSTVECVNPYSCVQRVDKVCIKPKIISIKRSILQILCICFLLLHLVILRFGFNLQCLCDA